MTQSHLIHLNTGYILAQPSPLQCRVCTRCCMCMHPSPNRLLNTCIHLQCTYTANGHQTPRNRKTTGPHQQEMSGPHNKTMTSTAHPCTLQLMHHMVVTPTTIRYQNCTWLTALCGMSATTSSPTAAMHSAPLASATVLCSRGLWPGNLLRLSGRGGVWGSTCDTCRRGVVRGGALVQVNTRALCSNAAGPIIAQQQTRPSMLDCSQRAVIKHKSGLAQHISRLRPRTAAETVQPPYRGQQQALSHAYKRGRSASITLF
jgi:hypothetical protein